MPFRKLGEPFRSIGNILGSSGGGGNFIDWLLRVEFSTPDAAPLTNPYVGEVSSLAITDTNNILSVSGGNLIINGMPAAGGNPRTISSASYARSAGLSLFSKLITITDTNRILIGFDASNLAQPLDTSLDPRTTYFVIDAGAIIDTGVAVATLDLGVACLRTTGGIFIVNNKIIWISTADNASPVYGGMGAGTSSLNMSIDYLRIAQLPAPFNTDFGLAMDGQAGAVVAGTTFDATSAYNATAGDGNQELVITTLPSAGQIEYHFRKQDSNNYWSVTVDNSGNLDLDEVVAGTPTQRGTSAGVIANGDRIMITVEDNTIKVYEANTLRITYTSAANFKTSTPAELNTLGTGGAVSDIWLWPRLLTGDAAALLNSYSADNV